MSLLKRLSITLFSRLDDVVADIENHDAIIEAAIDEQSKKIAAAKVQLNHLKRRQTNIAERLAQLQLSQNRWQSRAEREANQNEAKALECLQRRNETQRQINELESSRQEYRLAAEKLVKDIKRSETDLREVKQKRELLRARQSSSTMLKNTDYTHHSNLKQMEKTFERWEANLCEDEILHSPEPTIDSLEQNYVDQEQRAQLMSELEQLKASQNQTEQRDE